MFVSFLNGNRLFAGTDEALECAELLKQSNYKFDRAYTSLLTRAHQTLKIIAEHVGQPTLPVDESWRLNERHYGALTGYNKAELAAKYGEKQVRFVVRGYPNSGTDSATVVYSGRGIFEMSSFRSFTQPDNTDDGFAQNPTSYNRRLIDRSHRGCRSYP